jgi:hypothetical protein
MSSVPGDSNIFQLDGIKVFLSFFFFYLSPNLEIGEETEETEKEIDRKDRTSFYFFSSNGT